MDPLTSLLLTIAGLLFGSLEWRIRRMSDKISNLVDKDSMHEFVDLKTEIVRQSTKELKEDVHRLEAKIDKLLDKLSS
jgi:polyhydroxyalkanoate synthesis regulator phasin